MCHSETLIYLNCFLSYACTFSAVLQNSKHLGTMLYGKTQSEQFEEDLTSDDLLPGILKTIGTNTFERKKSNRKTVMFTLWKRN